jgi:hypothetical protein
MSAALPAFDYQRLDAFKVARETLRLGDALARRLPRGYPNFRSSGAEAGFFVGMTGVKCAESRSDCRESRV